MSRYTQAYATLLNRIPPDVHEALDRLEQSYLYTCDRGDSMRLEILAQVKSIIEPWGLEPYLDSSPIGEINIGYVLSDESIKMFGV